MKRIADVNPAVAYFSPHTTPVRFSGSAAAIDLAPRAAVKVIHD
ncbi:hypothetical protein GALLN_00632 [Gallionellaceae bacterium]|nr:hypothetical protein GALLN_00632 [Gallionellaceae bacterium]